MTNRTNLQSSLRRFLLPFCLLLLSSPFVNRSHNCMQQFPCYCVAENISFSSSFQFLSNRLSFLRLTVAFHSFKSLSSFVSKRSQPFAHCITTDRENHLICSSDCRVVIERREKRRKKGSLELENRYTWEGDRLVERVSHFATPVTWEKRREKYRLLPVCYCYCCYWLLLCLWDGEKREAGEADHSSLCFLSHHFEPSLLLLRLIIIIYPPSSPSSNF